MYNAGVIVQCSQIEKINLANWEGNMLRYQFVCCILLINTQFDKLIV